ncbi:DUF1566 domain-containing protein [Halorhodospira sp. 9622]|uniref:Lcl domain-containing protein n=1 Tax=Halorhodospira sp. 9622 TaxID=2899136 RepID=UPI001EE8C82E|nr:DUF1566 domain-containing protein [Halorhodospira sp. 9622]MCG5539348.1 DUF1566 domain-containing protein [Halorhodospira sp. 9622]
MEASVQITIGRKSDEGQEPDVVFPAENDDVSRLHAVATWEPALNCVVVRDQGSVNGTTGVDGAVVAADGSIRVEPGQAVLLGEQRLEFIELKRALDQKRRQLAAEQAREQAEQARVRRRRRVLQGVAGVTLVAVLAAGAWLWLAEREQRQMLEADREELRQELSEVRTLAGDAGVALEQARAARDEAEQVLEQSRRELEDAEMAGSFVLNEDGTVTDARTGLMWRQCPLGMEWYADKGCAGVFERFPWVSTGNDHTVQAGVDLINRDGGYAGHDDWRLPESWELLTLVEKDGGLREPEAFVEVPLSVFWTRTPWEASADRYEVVDFEDGLMKWHEGARELPVMIVREDERVSE